MVQVAPAIGALANSWCCKAAALTFGPRRDPSWRSARTSSSPPDLEVLAAAALASRADP